MSLKMANWILDYCYLHASSPTRPLLGYEHFDAQYWHYMLMTHSGRPVLLLSHPQVLAGGHHRRQELLPHRGCWIGDTGKGGTGFADLSCGSSAQDFRCSERSC